MTDSRQSRRSATLWDHLANILKWRKLVMIVMSVSAAGALCYALLAQTWFKADVRILPPPQGNMGLSGLLPSLNVGSLGVGSLLSNEANLTMTILDSRRLRDAVIDSFNWMEVYPLRHRIKAYKRYNKVVAWEMNEDGTVIISVEEVSAELAANTANFISDEVKELFHEISVAQARGQREFIQRRLDQCYVDIDSAEERLRVFQEETGLIDLEAQVQASAQVEAALHSQELVSQVTLLAELETQRVLAEIQADYFSRTLTPQSSEVLMANSQAQAYRERIEQIRHELDAGDVDYFVGVDIDPATGIESVRLTRELEIQGLILDFLLPQYEQARIVEMQERSNLYVLDEAVPPTKKSKPKRAYVILAWLFVTFLILYGVILFLEWLNQLEQEDPERYRLVSGVLRGLHPKSFFGRDDSDSRDSISG